MDDTDHHHHKSNEKSADSDEKISLKPTNQELVPVDNDVLIEPPIHQEPDKCPVCLQNFSSSHSKSYTSKCFHSFCFECILEWSKVRYNCPLCKTEFDRILYEVHSRLDFNEYALKPKEANPTQDVIPIYPENEAHASYRPPPARVSKASWVLNNYPAPLEFRMLVYSQKWYVSQYQTQTYVRTTNIELEGEATSGENGERDENVTSDNLVCACYRQVTGYKKTSPQWFSQNPACLHRLMSFLHRELKAIATIMPKSSHERLNQE